MTSLDQQIDNCQKLLRMFQEEREQYTERQSLELHDVLESMKQKQRLVEVFEVQKQFAENPPQSEAERKQLRVLGELLEQLLVIEQENEILLSRLLKASANPAAKPEVAKTQKLRMRPSLQQQLPFIPKSRETTQPVNKPSALKTNRRLMGKYI